MGLIPFTIRHYTALKINEDLMQEGYIALWKAAGHYDPESGTLFSTYAIKAIRNRLYQKEQRKLRSIQNVISLEELISEDGHLTRMNLLRDPDGEEPLRRIELNDWVERSLTEEERQILKKRMKGMGVRSIAACFGHSEPWGALRLKRIKEKLKRRNE